MPTQIELLGTHPIEPTEFHRWLSCNDYEITATKNHRGLNAIIESDAQLLNWLSDLLIVHHYSDENLELLREKYSELGYPLFAEQNRRLPTTDKTKKGNLAEILLVEYIISCVGSDLLKAYRLRYNTNVDQSMKGDDALLVKLLNQGEQSSVKVYFGEAKYRATPNKDAVDKIVSALASNKNPISYSYLITELLRNEDTKELGKQLSNFNINEIKRLGNLTYIGLLMSNENSNAVVHDALDSSNESLIFVSLGSPSPNDLVEQTYLLANGKIAGGVI